MTQLSKTSFIAGCCSAVVLHDTRTKRRNASKRFFLACKNKLNEFCEQYKTHSINWGKCWGLRDSGRNGRNAKGWDL